MTLNTCLDCGDRFETNAKNAKYCPACQLERHRFYNRNAYRLKMGQTSENYIMRERRDGGCEHCEHIGFCNAAVEYGRPLHSKCEKHPEYEPRRIRELVDANVMELEVA